MPRQFKVVSVNRINHCCPSYATKALHLASWPNTRRTNNYKRAIVNDPKRKSSRIRVLCGDLVFFRLRSKRLSPVCTGTAFLFVKCNRSENQFPEQKERRQNDLASFCVQWTQKRGPKPLQKFRGARGARNICSPKIFDFWRLRNKILR